MSSRHGNEPLLPALAALGGISVVVGMMSYELMGPTSPLRSHAIATGAGAGTLDLWALILGIGLPVVAIGCILAYLALEGKSRGRQ